MKLETKYIKYLTPDDWQVLTAMDVGSKNHEIVPTTLIVKIANLRTGVGATNRCISDLAKIKLIAKVRNAKYDGYKLTFNGFDYLSLRAMMKNHTLKKLLTTIGVGKESDIYAAIAPDGEARVLKIHRLGRVSFRSVKNKRDYLRNKQAQSWMYLSRLAAEREWDFMNILHSNGFSVPTPYDYSRHCVLMERVKGFTMKILRECKSYRKLYSQLMCFIVKLANSGLIHGDFNEYNIMIKEDGTFDPQTELAFVVIDFPQCISIEHPDAEFYFQRDVDCIRRFFRRRFKYIPKANSSNGSHSDTGYGDEYKYAYPIFKRDVKRTSDLDVQVKASGYRAKLNREDRDLQGAVASMSKEEKAEEDEDSKEDEDSEGEEEQEEHEEQDVEEVEEEEQEHQVENENEKIIEALSSGRELKMDKFGNYILPNDDD
ncbi:Serine kinase [Brettanomyces bruxellensis]|uniref:Serine/threonine-protein kinase RIO2 n=1 Tax=Dekkera bruxellensis TaxID=5007 RepID=A0A8H6EYE5_DEKBR|nr:Serine kinase [Brettanomyces bruxellensis]